jgi:DNA-binding winged helix-turn-helix (wHTH) protein
MSDGKDYQFEAEDLRINLSHGCAHYRDQHIYLSDLQLKMLECIHAASPFRTKRETIIDAVWGNEAIEPNNFDQALKPLRDKLSQYGLEISNVPRSGYRIERAKESAAQPDNDNAVQATIGQPKNGAPESHATAAEASIDAFPNSSQEASPSLETQDAYFARFLADTRIAAQFTTTSGTRSVYLDDVYIHRSRSEEAALEGANQYLSTNGTVRGRWLSIVGDAGHGKTSLLWFLTQEFCCLCPRVFPIQALQLSSNALGALIHALPKDGRPFIVLLDTLDLLVGTDDTSLGAHLNSIRAQGGFLVTACRKQEIQSLARHVRSDQMIELGRYEPEEAHAAIERYVSTSFAGWSEGKRQAQIDYVWELLDARRRIQDLNFEPLLLRMIFEAYVPDGIPSDINTQLVYDHFWNERIFGDRVAKTPEEARTRGTLSLALASYIYFETQLHTERVSVDAFLNFCESRRMLRPLTTLEGLVSSGVLRWWQMKASVGFFHQTFLEYTAAKNLLELNDKAARNLRIDHLLADTESANLFRVPVLKQLMIQASGTDAHLFESLCVAVTEIRTPVAARLALEVLGKAPEISCLYGLMLEWNMRQPELFRAVAPEVLRYYPAARVGLALEILAPHMHGEAIGEICYVCSVFFAPMEPHNTLMFMQDIWRAKPTSFRLHEASLKSVLIAVFKAGETAALDAMAEILPTLSVGVQAGALDDLCALWTPKTTAMGAAFLDKMFSILAIQEENEPRGAFVRAFDSLHTANSVEAHALVRTLQARGGLRDVKATVFLARLVGIAAPDPSVIEEAFRDLLGTDHARRLCASHLLREAARTKNEVLDYLLALPADMSLTEEAINVIYAVASGSRDSGQMLAVLDRWNPTERGAGSAIRVLIGSAAKADPERTLAWLKARIPTAQTAGRRRQILVGFQMLAENAIAGLSVDDVRLFLQFGLLSADATDEMKRVFASAAGWVTEIDTDLAQEIFRLIFRSHKRESINAAIGSLRSVGSPVFLAFVFDLVCAFTARQKGYITFGHFLEVVSGRNLEVRTALVWRLATPECRAIMKRLDTPVVVSHLLGLFKSTVKADVALVLDLAATCPLLDEGNAATLSAVLENASHQTGDPVLARKILDRLLDLALIPSDRIRNSLHRALPVLDRLLLHREATVAVLDKILTYREWNEKALEHLVRAAKKMDSWARSDTETLLHEELPHSVKAVLLN